jgi:hypothetical protein
MSYDRRISRIKVNRSELKLIYCDLVKRDFTLDKISQIINCNFKNSLYKGYSLNLNSFNKLQNLYSKDICHKILPPIIKIVNLKTNYDLIELIGIILGDGHLNKKGNTLTITLNFADESNYVEYVINLLKDVTNIEPSIVKLPNNKANQIRVYGKGIVEELIKLGLKPGNKVKNQVNVPNWIKNNENYYTYCLKGLIDTDGSIHLTSDKKRIGINFKNNSKPLVQSFKDMCNKLKIRTNELYEGLTYSRGKIFSHYKLEITKQNQVKKFIMIVNPEKWKNRKHKILDIITKNGSQWASIHVEKKARRKKAFLG